MQYDKLLRILFTPRRVFDELREDQHTGLPVLAIIGIVAIATLVIATLSICWRLQEIQGTSINRLLSGIPVEIGEELVQHVGELDSWHVPAP
jgi:hypothetical protein